MINSGSNKCVITGTDTDIGKTVFCAMLMAAMNDKNINPSGESVSYWKPIQSGIEDTVDTKTVQNLTTLPDALFLPERYMLSEPLSPHRAAELDGRTIEVANIKLPAHENAMIIEGAGGLMVPLTREILLLDLFEHWHLPTILCARTTLGTINHTLLSIEALQNRDIPIHGLAFIGEDNPDNIRTIHEFSGVKVLGHLPRLDSLNANTLKQAFKDNFNIKDFIAAPVNKASAA